MNRDTLYSNAVFDLEAAPVTVTLPDSGKRFMSMQIIDEDQYTPMVVYGKGVYTLTKEKIGTRYVMAALRTLVDPNDSADVNEVHKLQDGVGVTQAERGSFQIPDWDRDSQDKVRNALLILGSTLPDSRHAFGARGEADPLRFVIAAAVGWGGNPDKDAKDVNVNPEGNDGTGIFKLAVKDVPVDGFWSISLYNGKGYFEPNPYNAYSVNNITARKDPDGGVTVQFGGCNGKTSNCLRPAGTILSDCIARAGRCWTARGSFPKHSP